MSVRNLQHAPEKKELRTTDAPSPDQAPGGSSQPPAGPKRFEQAIRDAWGARGHRRKPREGRRRQERARRRTAPCHISARVCSGLRAAGAAVGRTTGRNWLVEGSPDAYRRA